MKHNPEPWSAVIQRKVVQNYSFDVPRIVDANDNLVLDNLLRSEDEKNYDRIVTCVNACRHIPDEELETIVTLGLAHLAAHDKSPYRDKARLILDIRR